MSGSVITWADGFGVWHAQVPDGDDAQDQAWAAIADQLNQRERPGFLVAPMRMRYVGQVGDDVVYREEWPAPDGVPML